MSAEELRRSIGLPLLTFYGLGTILGAGIYVLVGEVVASAGRSAPSAFALAAGLAGLTAFSFAELGARIPRSAGEAAYALAAFGRPSLSALVGWAVIAVGTVSAATMVRGFVGYLEVFVELPPPLVIIALVSALTAVALWGVGESLSAAAAITVLEVAGLLFVCGVAGDSFREFAADWTAVLPSADATALLGVASGAFIAFYAFIGFEDIVNLAEEVRQPERNLPRAIVISLIVASALYILVAIVAVFAVPLEQIAQDAAPLAVIVESRGYPPGIIAAISLFAVVNGAMIQLIMASRVLYGLAKEGLALRAFGKVNRKTRTPVLGTLAVGSLVVALSLLLTTAGLARITSLIALAIFALVNLSLWRLKLISAPQPSFHVPLGVPVTGTILCAAMIVYEGLGLLL